MKTKDEKTGEVKYKKVTELYQNKVDYIREVKLNDGTKLHTTLNHPFFVKGKAWTEVKDIQLGDSVLTAKGELTVMLNNTLEAEETVVYNFEVEDTHSYFVGVSEVWVHNYSFEQFGKDFQIDITDGAKKWGEAKKNEKNGKGFYTNEEIEAMKKDLDKIASDVNLKQMTVKKRAETLRLISGDNPSIKEIESEIDIIIEEKKYPKELKSILAATRKKESGGQQFYENEIASKGINKGDLVINVNSDGKTIDIGLMQLNDKSFKTKDYYKLATDWRYNLRTGIAHLNWIYNEAKESGLSGDSLARGTYSGYNAGHKRDQTGILRFQTGNDERDTNWYKYYKEEKAKNKRN